MSRVVAVVVVVLAGLVAGCGSAREDPDPGPKVTPPPGVRPAAALGASEGTLKLLAPSGYVPDAATTGYGCDVQVKTVEGADAVVRELSTGRYDGALGNGDATVRLIGAGAIAPVNTALVPNYRDVYDGLKRRPFNSVGGQMFALPVGRAMHLIVWRRDKIPGTLTNLGALLDRAQAASVGTQLIVPDDPASIAEAARWYGRQDKTLEIADPYELDRRQFDAVLTVLRQQHPYVTEYWREPGAVREAFRSGRASLGLASQDVVGALEAQPGEGGPISSARPREGATGVSPAWMVAAKAKHPNCMYRFMNRVLDPAINAQTARDTAIAPANRRACDAGGAPMQRHCDAYHADDDGFYSRTLYRTTPSSDCGDARGRVCMDWEDWVRAWKQIVHPS